MTEKTIYVAFDGKEFEDEYDCREYELSENGKMLVMTNDLLTYDKNGKQMFVSQADCDYERIDYVVFKSKPAYDYFAQLMCSCSLSYPDEIEAEYSNYKCSYYYDYKYDEWRNINNKIEELQSQIDNLSKYLVKED